MFDTITLTPAERAAITRSGAHTVPVNHEHPETNFRDGVTDLDVARVFYQIERRAEVRWSAAAARWVSIGMPHTLRLHATVQEMLRTGLATERIEDLKRVLRPAAVHLRHLGMPRRPACDRGNELRFRLIDDDRTLVDCLDCVR